MLLLIHICNCFCLTCKFLNIWKRPACVTLCTMTSFFCWQCPETGTTLDISVSCVTLLLQVFYYVYAIIGTEIFNGLIKYYGYDETDPLEMYCGNPLLQGSEFYTKRYCSNNFNNILSSMVVLFELMVVNQWHIITSGYVLVTNKGARVYFISFHLLCVIILLKYVLKYSSMCLSIQVCTQVFKYVHMYSTM